MTHNPSDPNCPRNADPRNETCGCQEVTMGHYEMQVLVSTTMNGENEWRSVRPSHGEPYRYATREEAERMLRICYPDEVTEIRLGAEPKVRVLYVLEDK